MGMMQTSRLLLYISVHLTTCVIIFRKLRKLVTDVEALQQEKQQLQEEQECLKQDYESLCAKSP